jgi:signal transduction histidine kinase
MRMRPPASPLDVLAETADAVTSALLSGELTPSYVNIAVRRAAAETGLSKMGVTRDLYRLVATDPRMLSAEPRAALDAELEALVGLGPVFDASLWLVDAEQEICVARKGASVPARGLRRLARRVVTAGPEIRAGGGGVLHGLPLLRWDRPWGVLIVAAKARWTTRAQAFAQIAALALSPLIERHLLLEDAQTTAQQLLQATDRRVTRLGFDIHDGPLQDLSLLVGELAVFERQLQNLVPEEGARRVARKRVADLRAIAVELDEDLREITSTTCGDAGSLHELLEQAVAHLRRRTGVDARLTIEGDIERITNSQRIAVARVVEEALANVREHSRATQVSVTLSRRGGFLHLTVADNGRGFDVARARRRAQRDRRLGLMAMEGRVRLLGGHLVVDSQPGHPTTLSASVPAWDSAPGALASAASRARVARAAAG